MNTFSVNKFDWQGKTLRVNLKDLGRVNADYLTGTGFNVDFRGRVKTFRFTNWMRNGYGEFMGWSFRSDDGFDVFIYNDGDC